MPETSVCHCFLNETFPLKWLKGRGIQMLTFFWHFNTCSKGLIIDTIQIAIFLLEKPPLHPLTQGNILFVKQYKTQITHFKRDSASAAEFSHTKTPTVLVFLNCISLHRAQDVCRWADCNFVQTKRPSHVDLLECFLQLRTQHCFPRTYNFGLAVSDKLNSSSDYLGFLCPAVLFVNRQLCWGCF